MSLQALVFDFDGLILDTEWSAFSTAAEVWSEHGIELELAVWQEIVGTAEHVHWSEMLETDLGRPIDRDAVIPARQAQHHAEVEAMDLLPGAEDLIRAASIAGLAPRRRLQLAAGLGRWSSRAPGPIGSLRRRRLSGPRRHDQARPEALHAAVEAVGVDPPARRRPGGLPPRHRVAEAAGLACVAVPNRVTAGQDFSAARLRRRLPAQRLDDPDPGGPRLTGSGRALRPLLRPR